jgi:hypothetical protein
LLLRLSQHVKREIVPPPPLCNLNASKPEELGDKRLLPQKTIEITTDQALKLIKDFKSGMSSQNNQISQGKLIEADSVSLDSSIFVVEAALNYDFDYNNADTAFNVLLPDTSEFTIPITRANQKVNSDDLEGVYLQLYQHIESLVSGRTKVKVVDMEAYISGNQVYYRAVIIRNYYWMTVKDCMNLVQSEYPDDFCFPSSATSVIGYKLLNCRFLPCPYSWYFNVSSLYISNVNNSSTYSGILYYNSPINFSSGGSNWCDYTLLTTSQLNSYVNNIENYVNSVKPLGKSVANIDLHSYKSPNTSIGWSYVTVYWYMTMYFGQVSIQGC